MRHSLVPALALLIAVASISTAAPEGRDKKADRQVYPNRATQESLELAELLFQKCLRTLGRYALGISASQRLICFLAERCPKEKDVINDKGTRGYTAHHASNAPAPRPKFIKDGRGRDRPRSGKEHRTWRERNSSKPAAHLIGVKRSNDQILSWDHAYYMTFTRHNIEYKDSRLTVNSDGLYYVYCQVGFHGKKPNVTLHSTVSASKHKGHGEIILLDGSESVTGPTPGSTTWYASLSQGGLADLKKGESLYVSVSHPDLVDYSGSKTFFGLVKVS